MMVALWVIVGLVAWSVLLHLPTIYTDIIYSQDCVSTLKKSCGKDFKAVSVKDTTIWRWKDSVIQKTSKALSKLGFFGDINENSVR